MKKVFLNLNYINVFQNFFKMYELHQVLAQIFNKLWTFYEILQKVLNLVV